VLPIPERLAVALADRYRVERELGAGGTATVYLAADLKQDREVAIKVLTPEHAAVSGAERFVQSSKRPRRCAIRTSCRWSIPVRPARRPRQQPDTIRLRGD